MEETILKAVNEYLGENFATLEAVRSLYSDREIFDMFLDYEGIIGYGDRILKAMEALGLATKDEGRSMKPAPDAFQNIVQSATAKQIYALGVALSRKCPNNDCRVYLNTFIMCRELDEQVGKLELEGTPQTIIKRELCRMYRELDELYHLNDAVREYRRSPQKGMTA